MMDIDKLEASPELDALVAEKVMGWKLGKLFPSSESQYWIDSGGEPTLYRTLNCKDREITIFQPSLDIACAWEVVEKLEMIVGPGGEGWQAMEQYDLDAPGFHATAPSAPLAICRAALKAVGA